MATQKDLEALQDGISASIQTLLQAYDQCTDPVESATIIVQTKQLAAQMSQIETRLFHQQAIQAGPAVDSAFGSAQGFTMQLRAMSGKFERMSEIIGTGAKLVDAVAVLVGCLAI